MEDGLPLVTVMNSVELRCFESFVSGAYAMYPPAAPQSSSTDGVGSFETGRLAGAGEAPRGAVDDTVWWSPAAVI
jgi:hypothetical protein